MRRNVLISIGVFICLGVTLVTIFFVTLLGDQATPPSNPPGVKATSVPTKQPTASPTVRPEVKATSVSTRQSTAQPSVQPTAQPTLSAQQLGAQATPVVTGTQGSQPTGPSTPRPGPKPTVVATSAPKPKPTPVPTKPPILTRAPWPTYKSGSSGLNVYTIQCMLIEYNINLPRDSVFGAQTTTKVKEFQSKHSLSADGIVGPQTWEKLISMRELGSTGAIVTALQRQLNANGFSVPVDGTFGPATKQAIINFQKSRNIVVDGVAGAQTWSYLVSSSVGRP